jgi:uncharacterized glyoxalase superfamily protein PhnB
VIIVPEAATNSLIVSATPRIYNEVVAVIQKLDERPPMVMIQVLIAEVRLNDTDEFGVELGLQDSLLFDRSLLGEFTTITTTTDTQSNGNIITTTQDEIVNAPGQPGFNFNNQPLGNNLSENALATAANVAAQGLSSFSLNRVNSELGFGGFPHRVWDEVGPGYQERAVHFGAREIMRMATPGGKLGHAEFRIGATNFFIADEYPTYRVLSPLTLNGSSVSFSIAVPDADAAFARAIDAGAKVERPLADEPFGRSGWLVDPFGHRWNVVQGPKSDG